MKKLKKNKAPINIVHPKHPNFLPFNVSHSVTRNAIPNLRIIKYRF